MIGEENVEENMVEYLDDQVDPAGPGSIESLVHEILRGYQQQK